MIYWRNIIINPKHFCSAFVTNQHSNYITIQFIHQYQVFEFQSETSAKNALDELYKLLNARKK